VVTCSPFLSNSSFTIEARGDEADTPSTIAELAYGADHTGASSVGDSVSCARSNAIMAHM